MFQMRRVQAAVYGVPVTCASDELFAFLLDRRSLFCQPESTVAHHDRLLGSSVTVCFNVHHVLLQTSHPSLFQESEDSRRKEAESTQTIRLNVHAYACRISPPGTQH